MKSLNNINHWKAVIYSFTILFISGVIYCCSSEQLPESSVEEVVIAQRFDIAALANEMGLNINLEDDYFNMQFTIEEWRTLFERAQKVLSIIDTTGRESFVNFCDVLPTKSEAIFPDSLPRPSVDSTTKRDTTSVCDPKTGSCQYTCSNLKYTLTYSFSWTTPTPCHPGIVGGNIEISPNWPVINVRTMGASFIWFGDTMFKYSFTVILECEDSVGDISVEYDTVDLYIATYDGAVCGC